MITKEKAIQVLEAALANPRYLANKSVDSGGTNYFCSSVIMVLLEDKTLQGQAESYAEEIQGAYIYPSINGCLFLKTHLANTGIIEYGTLTNEPVYKIAARNHWATLIQSLKDSEQ